MIKTTLIKLNRQDLADLGEKLDRVKLSKEQQLSCLIVLVLHYDIDYMTTQQKRDNIAEELNQFVSKEMGQGKLGLRKGDRKTTVIPILEQEKSRKLDDKDRHIEFVRKVEKRGAKILNEQQLLEFMLHNTQNAYTRAVVEFCKSNLDFCIQDETYQVIDYWLGHLALNQIKTTYIEIILDYDEECENKNNNNSNYE